MFPRLYELREAVPYPTDPNAYFQHFEERLKESAHFRGLCLWVERSLQTLDPELWRNMLERAVPLTMDRHPARGWQALFDTLNEAKGVAYLKRLGCSGIEFIRRNRKKTPDLRAVLDGRLVLCEVKTINISLEEADRRRRLYLGEILAASIMTCVTTQMLDKVTDTLNGAVEQLDCADPNRAARRFIFTVLHFDDWVGDYQAECIAQIDKHLAANPVQAAELVFCPASNLFKRHFTMQSATIVEI
jgi:hypothetical protein